MSNQGPSPEPDRKESESDVFKNSIPQQTQISVEQEEKLAAYAIRREFILIQMFRIRWLLLVALAIALPIGIIMLSYGMGNPTNQADTVTIDAPSDFDTILSEGNPTSLINLASKLQAEVVSGSVPEKMAALEKRRKIGDVLLNSGTENANLEGTHIKLNSLMALVSLTAINSIQNDFFIEDLETFSSVNEDANDKAVCARAKLGLLVCELAVYRE